MKKIAFLSTSFGFGPVSKAVTIARALAARRNPPQLDYFGSGIDMEYARKSDIYQGLIEVNTDSRAELSRALPLLEEYDLVIAVLSLDLLPLWKKGRVPMFFVDSLAWMWSAAPEGIDNADIYFLQDYLLDGTRREWMSESLPTVLVAPIEAARSQPRYEVAANDRLLVNFSGCMNPFAGPYFYCSYVEVLTSIILECAAGRFSKITICCNEHLCRHLRETFGDRSGLHIGHLSHEEFLRHMATDSMVLTTPGITTTLEAMQLNRPVKYLLPQNYSQYLISERYKELLPPGACMAFSAFGEAFALPPGLEESKGVELVMKHLAAILQNHTAGIRTMIAGFLAGGMEADTAQLAGHITRRWAGTGQEMIANYCV